MRTHARSFAGLAVVVALLGTPAVALPLFAAADSARLPRTDFPACSTTVTTYCISSVTFLEAGVEKSAKWIPTGTPGLDASGAVNTKTYNLGPTPTTYEGRWSYDGFPFTTRDFDGVYVEAEPANEFTDTMAVRVLPAGPSAAGQVGLVRNSTTNRTLSLPADMGMKVTVRLGELNPAVTLAAGTEVSIDNRLDGTVSVFTLQGLPVAVPSASSTKDCASDTSVAVDNRNQLFAFVAFKNGRDPFGVDGLSGDMVVTSNGFCEISTPTWNSATKSMDFTASAPHFAPDGATVNVGFYRATIPAADASLLFGITDLDSTTTSPASTTTTIAGQSITPVTSGSTSTTVLAPVSGASASAVTDDVRVGGAAVVSTGVRSTAFLSATKSLTVEVREASDGSTVTAARNVAFDGRNFTVTATGFSYSKKTMSMRQGPPPNAPSKVSAVSVKRSARTLTTTFRAADNTTYYILVQRARAKASKTTCTARSRAVTCKTKNLPKGSYTVKVTPVKDGMVASPTSKKIVVP